VNLKNICKKIENAYDQYPAIVILLSLFYFFNLFDTLSTYFLIKYKLAVEVNVLVAFLLEKNPIYFFLFKFFVSLLFVAMIWLGRRQKAALYSVIIISTMYGLLFLYQVCLITYLIFIFH
jgi:hypothetical protein